MNTSQKIMVTGGSGYIASWVVNKLLERGFQVHATVRDLEAGAKVSHLLKMREDFGDQLALFEADLLLAGSFDKAVQGCNAVIHCASPFFTKTSDPEKDLIIPAKEGTENVLRSARDSGSVRRVVLTSSVAAVHSDNIESLQKPSGILDETDWNSTASASYQPYSLSKTIAEKAAWEFTNEQDQFDLVVINPGFVLGPSLSKRLDGTSVSTMAEFFSGQFQIGIPDLFFGLVDVRDVAEAHILALLNEKAQGRFITVSAVRSLYDLGSYLKGIYGDALPIGRRKLPKFVFYLMGPFFGFSWKNIRNNYGIPVQIDSSRSKEILGLSYTEIEQTVIDHAEQMLADGLVKLKS